VARLPIIKLGDKYYYRDKRLSELRAIDDPYDSIHFEALISALGPSGFVDLMDLPDDPPAKMLEIRPYVMRAAPASRARRHRQRKRPR
jgi:hypothetical protein